MKIVLVLALAPWLIFFACSPPADVAATPAPAAAAVKAPGGDSARDWNDIVAQAKKEGGVVFMTTLPPGARQAIAAAFQSRYGLEVEYITGRGSELAEKLRSQRQAGLYLADLFMAGAEVPTTSLKPGGFLDPIADILVLPEVTDTKVWYGSAHQWVDREKKFIFTNSLYPAQTLAVNTELVRPDAIKSWRDVLSPSWKGKIVINDPTVPGNGARWFGVTGSVTMAMDFMRELVKQEPVFSRDQRLQVEWVARGRYFIGLGPQVPSVTEFRKAGAPIAWVLPSEGTYLSGGSTSLSLVNRPAHPYAAQVFINWLLTREGATILAKETLFQSTRLDVPTDFLTAEETRDPAQKYFIAETEDFLISQLENMRAARDIFGPLMK